jgi:hypothetical protein
MGNHGDGKSYPMHRNNQRIGVAIAGNPAGPWKRLDAPIVDITDDRKSFDSLCVTNPAACIRPDGGVVLVYKAVQYIDGKEMGGNVRYGVALADKPEGPYIKTPGKIFEAEKPGKHWMVAEDPFIWHSKKYGNRYYAVTRDVVGTFTGSSGGICLFQSDDGLDLETRRPSERSSILIENDDPTYLFGAADGYKKHGKISTNVQIPLVP